MQCCNQDVKKYFSVQHWNLWSLALWHCSPLSKYRCLFILHLTVPSSSYPHLCWYRTPVLLLLEISPCCVEHTWATIATLFLSTVEYLLYCHSLLRAYQTSVLCCYQRLASYSTICQIDSVSRRNISAPNLWHTAIVVELSSVLRGRLIAVHTPLNVTHLPVTSASHLWAWVRWHFSLRKALILSHHYYTSAERQIPLGQSVQCMV